MLLSSKQAEGASQAAAASAPPPESDADLNKRVQRLEAVIAGLIKRVVYLEDQLSVRHSASVLSASDTTHAAEQSASASESVALVVSEPPKPQWPVPVAAPTTALSRLATYKREKRSFFGRKRE
jgi:hypothetical protein